MKHEPKNQNNDGVNSDGANAGQASVKIRRARKIIGIVLYSLLFAVLAFLITTLVWIIVDRCTSKSPVTNVYGHSFLVVVSGSMSGTIEVGDMVIISKTEDYKVGDIITFLPEGDDAPTTHRIVRIDGENIYTRGDANGNSEDPRPITYDNILGEVVSVIPNVGLFFSWFAFDFGWIYMVGIVAIIVIGIVLIKKIPSKKDEE